MKQLEETKSALIIVVPNGLQDLKRFRKGLLSVLSRIQIEDCETEFKEDLKAVYELLSHLQIEGHVTKSASEFAYEKFNLIMSS